MGAMSCHSCCYQHGTGTSRQPPKWPPVLDRCSFQKDKLPSWKKVVILSNSDGSHALQPTTSTPPPFNLHFGGFTNLSTCLLLHFWLNPYKPEAKELTIRLSWKGNKHPIEPSSFRLSLLTFALWGCRFNAWSLSCRSQCVKWMLSWQNSCIFILLTYLPIHNYICFLFK